MRNNGLLDILTGVFTECFIRFVRYQYLKVYGSTNGDRGIFVDI